MCTAISQNGYFGRTLDLEGSRGEEAVIMPRRFPVRFLREVDMAQHPAVIGCALVNDGVPLWFDAVNEYGLAAACLNFPEYATYLEPKADKINLASFELIPFVLSKCRNLREAEELLKHCNITPDSVSPALPATPLHWMIADREGCIAVEPTAGGLIMYNNPLGVLTNSPPFPVHRDNAMLHPKLTPSSASGLPGDWSSESRFLRALFAKKYTAVGGVNDFFHMMDSVSVPLGCGKKDWRTVYTSCADLDRGDYYFTTYENREIKKISLAPVKLDLDEIFCFSMNDPADIEKISVYVDKAQQM